MKVIPKKTFLLRQDHVDGEKPKDVIAKKGVMMEVSEKEAAAFFGLFEIKEDQKKKLIQSSKMSNSSLRRIV